MCKFLSANSDGQGKTIFFKIEDIVKEMACGNPESYDWNSHTSIAHFYGIKGKNEDLWNKWEYNPETKELKVDNLVITDDRDEVKKAVEKYLKDKYVGYLRNLYNKNSGNGNSGNKNSGNKNSGNGNSGSLIGHFCTKEKYFLFDKPCTKDEAEEVRRLNLWQDFDLTEWISESSMSNQEKRDNPFYKTIGGYLKVNSYKDAWKKVPKETIDKIKKLKNFNKAKFFEITGIR